MLPKVILTAVCFIGVGSAFRPCIGPSKQFDGYTYIEEPDTGQKVWSHCAFFNPLADHALCGRPVRPGIDGYLCDPDNLLKTNKSMDVDTFLDQRLREVQDKTAIICYNNVGERVRVIVAVAVIDRVRIPDLPNPDLCINDCGQLLPWRDSNGWYPDDQDQYTILKIFADGLRRVWKIGQCENEVIVLYCKEFNKVQFSIGARAASYLTQHQIQQFQLKFTSFLNDTNYPESLEQGLLYLLDRLQETLKSVKVAVILISTVLSLAFGLQVWFLIYAARHYYEVNILRHTLFTYPWKAMTWVFKLGSGVWLTQQTILLLMTISQKWGKECLAMLGAIFVVLIPLYSVIMSSVVTGQDTENQDIT